MKRRVICLLNSGNSTHILDHSHNELLKIKLLLHLKGIAKIHIRELYFLCEMKSEQIEKMSGN